MLQRWMITLVVSTVSCVLFSACQKKNYSPDEPLATTYTPSLFISSQNKYLYALDPVNGSEKWEYNLHGATVATPVIVANKFLFVATVDSLFKLDVNTGKLLKVYNDGAYAGITSSPVTDGSMLYIASNPAANQSTVFAINPNTDAVTWKKDYSSNISSSLAIYQTQLFVAKEDGSVDCITTGNGTNVWATPANIPITGGPLFSSPTVSYPYVYIGGTDKNLYALNMNSGTQAWTFATTGVVNSSPIVYGGNVIFGCSDNYIYCVDSIGKNIRWKFKTSDRVISSAAAYRNVVYMGGYDANVYALNIIDGNLKWQYKANALFKASMLNVEGAIYAASFDKILYKLDTSGTLKWTYNINGAIESSPILYDYNATKTYYPSISGMYQY